jgi:hypothetical protein
MFHAGTATAADSPSQRPIPAQQAMQEVLTGTHTFHVTPGIRADDVGTMKSVVGVQQSMQEVLLGPSRFRVGITETTGRTGGSREVASIRHQTRSSPDDTQAAVQRMLRGDHVPTGPVS